MFFVFFKFKKGWNYTNCVRLFYSLHIQQWMRNHWKGQRTVAVIPFSDVGILNPKISCALLSHHLVNSCRLVHNFSAAWSMGSKESGLIPVLLYHVPGQIALPIDPFTNIFKCMHVSLQHPCYLFVSPATHNSISIDYWICIHSLLLCLAIFHFQVSRETILQEVCIKLVNRSL